MNQTTLTSLTIAGVSAISLLGASAPVMAAAIGVDWTTPTTGDLNGTTVTLSNFSFPSISTSDLSGSDYSAAPLSSSQEIIVYDANSDWTATFSNPVSDLLLYPRFWRPTGGDISPVTYEFDQSFTILSGLTGATVVGNTLSLPTSGFSDGVIQFSGPISSLTVNTSSTSFSGQSLTFGVDHTPPPVSTPEPATILGLLAVGSLATLSRKSKG
ncbi:MAG: PEP-CTERM sorting domain-containing protein [Crocosphaera sp.]